MDGKVPIRGRARGRARRAPNTDTGNLVVKRIGKEEEEKWLVTEKGDKGKGIIRRRIMTTKPEGMATKKGTTGEVVSLVANYFQFEKRPSWSLYQYRVDFVPEEDQNKLRKQLLRKLANKLRGYIFDGTMLFSAHSLTSQPVEPLEEEVESLDGKSLVKIIIRQVGKLESGDPHYLQFFNILMRRCLEELKLQLVGRNFYDPISKVEIPEYKLELWPGYITSIRQHEQSILMCAEISHKVLRQENVYNLLLASLDESGKAEYMVAFKKSIIGSIVWTTYNNKTYRIDDVEFGASPSTAFTWHGGNITYVEYYRKKYGLNIKNMNQPLLVSRCRARERRSGLLELIFLVPELCRMTGLTDAMINNFNLMRTIAEHTRVGPSNRVKKLKEMCRRLQQTDMVGKELASWDMELSQDLTKIEGRILPAESIITYGAKFPGSQPADWTRDLRGRKMLVSLPEMLGSWVVLVPRNLQNDTNNFVHNLVTAAKNMQLSLSFPHIEQLYGDSAVQYVEGLEAVINRYNPHLIMCVVPNNRSDRYAAIKKKCCVDRSVATQVVVAKIFRNKGVMSIASKVVVQMNCKVGGCPWSVDIPIKGLMVVGFDVCHDKSCKTKSYGAVVASLDKQLSRYFSAVSIHVNGEELSNDLSIQLCKAVRKYSEYNEGSLPERVIVYRDGVGEGQIRYVCEQEVKNVYTKLQEVYENAGAKLKFAFVIVSKRINTRLFQNVRCEMQNPPPGTIVDDVITLPERYDFFLVSQSVRQGTVSPTSYNVIFDELGLSPDRLQRLTYKLTHLYYNWSGTVRVPAPCQYAHKLAYLVGQSLHRAPNDELEDVLYFL